MTNTLVSYEGGGYDGCITEQNYAYFDWEGDFHDVLSTGLFGLPTREKFDVKYKSNPEQFDFYPLDKEGESERFGWEAPVGRLIQISQWLRMNFPDVVIPAKCDCCGEKFDAAEGWGVDIHCVGGLDYAPKKIVCGDCLASHLCSHCGKWGTLGEDDMCEGCIERKAEGYRP